MEWKKIDSYTCILHDESGTKIGEVGLGWEGGFRAWHGNIELSNSGREWRKQETAKLAVEFFEKKKRRNEALSFIKSIFFVSSLLTFFILLFLFSFHAESIIKNIFIW